MYVLLERVGSLAVCDMSLQKSTVSNNLRAVLVSFVGDTLS